MPEVAERLTADAHISGRGFPIHLFVGPIAEDYPNVKKGMEFPPISRVNLMEG